MCMYAWSATLYICTCVHGVRRDIRVYMSMYMHACMVSDTARMTIEKRAVQWLLCTEIRIMPRHA